MQDHNAAHHSTDAHVAFGRPATGSDPTPEMIAAGVKALRYYLDNPRTPMGQVVIAIYRAMEDARAKATD